MFFIYFKLIKNSSKFKSLKNIIFAVVIVGIAFLICLPNTSEDIFYYMGTGRVLSHYGENPYYTTVSDLLKNNINDEILSASGIWRNITVVYGPIWVLISSILNKLSLGSVTFLIYIFKIANFIILLGTLFIIYKLTNKKKFVVAVAFNPVILLEVLINVHNDIYMIFFILLGIYFIKNKKNIWLRISFFGNIRCYKIYSNFNFTIFDFVLFKR